MFKTRQYYLTKLNDFLGLVASAIMLDLLVLIAVIV